MGGQPSTTIQMPAAPTPPTAAQTAADYASALPTYYQTALQYEPQMAALEKQINEQLYPQTAGLQETLAAQASQGMTQPLPDWYKQNVADTLKSTFGRNLVYNPQAQEQYGLATNQAYKDWGDYYRNLGLSVGNRQPLAASPNLMSSYTPAANMGFAQQGYGTQANVYGTQSQNYWNQQNYSPPWMNMLGTVGGGVGQGIGTGMGYAAMGAMMSSIRYKKNIKLWAEQ